MSENINIEGLDKAAVLATLYNASKPQGKGFLQFDSQPMTIEEAQQHLSQHSYFDYLKGRVMKIDLSDNVLNVHYYDRDNGNGAAAHAIQALRDTEDVNPEEVELQHLEETRKSAIEVQKHLDNQSSVNEENGITVINLGFDEHADEIKSKIDNILDD